MDERKVAGRLLVDTGVADGGRTIRVRAGDDLDRVGAVQVLLHQELCRHRLAQGAQRRRVRQVDELAEEGGVGLGGGRNSNGLSPIGWILGQWLVSGGSIVSEISPSRLRR